MLKPAILYKEELIKKYQNTWFDEDYKYYHSLSYNLFVKK